jgi:hypothetical protein
VEREHAAMARFVVGLNCEIHDILEYKGYANITHLFYFVCKAEREVQGRHASAKTNFLQEELIHVSVTIYVQPHCLLHQVRWCILHPTIAASLELLPQI